SLYISSNRWVYLILSSVSIGLALATRYVGLALFPPVIIVLFLFVKQPLKYKIKAFFTMVILALTPISFWVVRNLLLTRSAADRSIVFHPRSIRKMGRTLIEVLHDFILPISDSKYLKAFELIIIILILLYMISVLYKKRTQYNLANCIGISYISLGLLFSISYIIMVSFSIFFFDAATPVNERILLPVYLFSTISIISMFFLFSNIEKKQTVWLLFIVCALVSIRINIFPMLSTSNEFHTNGIGYNSRTWNEDPTLSILKSIGPDNKVFSNAYDLISIKTGIEAFPFPKSYNSSTTLENNSYNEQLSSMCDEVMKGDAIIVFLFQIKRDYFPTEETILEKCQPPVLYDVKNGKIYGISIKNKNDSN
ncbi:MAG: hypothetical protein LLG42_05295, partial [Chloroflexi bacterium]|nr:hypothetical protein [Chloroflexota bacterium]